jgi:hypothetical protein
MAPLACTDEALIIRRYYFPPHAKRIPYRKIRQVRRAPLGSMGCVPVAKQGKLITT